VDYLVIEDTGSIDRTAGGLPRQHPLEVDLQALKDAILIG
jgi:hypothetical protein